VVREKESGAIYNIYSATITRGEFLAGKLLPNVGISFANAVGLWGLAVAWFGTPFKGSFAFFLLVTFLYVVCLSCMGLVISLIVPTQSSALMISLVLSVLIGVQFSGMITPAESMKGPNFVLAHAFPALYYDRMLRGVFLKGVGLGVFWKDVLVLVAWPALLLWISHRMFRKRTAR
jgi:ABC-2 type transport system permease protein/ribosome-dependent ATPase